MSVECGTVEDCLYRSISEIEINQVISQKTIN